MTSTSEGLQAIASETGYQHHTTMEIKESVARGCPLCQTIFQDGVVSPKIQKDWSSLHISITILVGK